MFIGLGLYDEKDLTLRAMEEAKKCDELFGEFYTSALKGTTVQRVVKAIGREIKVLQREEVEEGSLVLKEAATKKVGFLVAGDPMTATTHVDLRLRAAKQGIATRIVHGVSILTAAAGLLGLQVYKFGRTVTIPFPDEKFSPTSPYELISKNRNNDLHTLILLDLTEKGTYMTADKGIQYLNEQEGKMKLGLFPPNRLVCVLARVGSKEPLIMAGRANELKDKDFGGPLHCLVLPGPLHFEEKEALIVLAGAPKDI